MVPYTGGCAPVARPEYSVATRTIPQNAARPSAACRKGPTLLREYPIKTNRKASQTELRTTSRTSAPSIAVFGCAEEYATTPAHVAVVKLATVSSPPCRRPRQLVTNSRDRKRNAAAAAA